MTYGFLEKVSNLVYLFLSLGCDKLPRVICMPLGCRPWRIKIVTARQSCRNIREQKVRRNCGQNFGIHALPGDRLGWNAPEIETGIDAGLAIPLFQVSRIGGRSRETATTRVDRGSFQREKDFFLDTIGINIPLKTGITGPTILEDARVLQTNVS